METIQLVIDKPLLQATNRMAKKAKVNRSEWIRSLIRDHMKRLCLAEELEKERRSYMENPDSLEDALFWEKEAAWPDD